MNTWIAEKKLLKHHCLIKKSFYSESNLKDITDEDYTYAQKVFEEFRLKNLGDYHNLYVQKNTLLLADVFENFKNKCIEIYKLDPAHLFSALGLAWQACLKKTAVELELLNDIDMLLMVGKGIRGRICHAIQRYAKANKLYIKNYDKNIESSYLMFLNANNLYGWRMSQTLPVNGFKWVKKLSKFDKRSSSEDFIKDYGENNNKGYLFIVIKDMNLFNLHCDLSFLPERKKIEKCNKLVCNIHDKGNYVVHIRALKQALNHD